MPRTSPPSRLPWWLVTTFLLLTAALVAVWIVVYHAQRNWLLDTSRRAMAGAAATRVDDLLAWRNERLAEAAALRANGQLIALSRSLAGPSARPEAEAAWNQLLAVILTRRDYVGAALFDEDAQIRRAVGSVDLARQVQVGQLISRALSANETVLSDPHRLEDGRVHMILAVPLAERRAAAAPPLGVVLEIDARRELDSLLRGRATPAANTEVLLVRPDADGCVVLGSYAARGSLQVGAHVSRRAGGPAVERLLNGSEGGFDGPSVRGVPAVGVTRRVGDTGWWLLSSVTTSSTLLQTRSEAWRILLVVGLLVVIAAVALLLAWERRQAALYRELRDKAEGYRTLFERANDAIVLADAESGRVIDANDKVAELTGRPLQELRGLHQMKLHPPEMEEWSQANFRMRTTDSRLETIQTYLQHVNGRRVPVEVSASRITLRGRTAIMGIFRDLTERFEKEEAIRRSEDGYRTAAEQTGQLFYDADVSSGRVAWRGAIAALTGYAPGEYAAFGASDREGFIHPDDRQRVAALSGTAVSTMTGYRAEYRYRRKDGSYFLAEDRGACLRGRDGGVRMIGTMRDVTETRAAEEELHASESRRQKLESLALLAGGIAHDFNNLLTGILGNISLARHAVAPDSDTHACLADAERASLRAKDLTRQLLTFSKGGAPVKKVVDVTRLLDETVSFACRGTAVGHEVRGADRPVHAEIDEGQIAQVINNIAINAVQAMPAGGTLTGTVEVVTLAADNARGLPAGRYAHLTLADTGVGIPPHLLSRIFDPYFTTKQQGSGLGLAISHSIVQRHGGYIGARSQPGAGAEFEVLLPASPSPASATGATAMAPAIHSGRVLVMDDEPLVRELALRMLGRLNFDGEGVADGAEALRAYRAAAQSGRPFDAVLMDLTISGGMGGKDTMAALLAMDPKARVVVSSGYSNDPIMASFRDFGFKAVLGKPYELHDLRTVLSSVLGEPEGV